VATDGEPTNGEDDVKTYVYPAGLDGCGYYRLIWPARALASQGHDVTVVLPDERLHSTLQITGRQDAQGNLVQVNYPLDADVIVMQRPTHKNLVNAVRLLREAGVTVVVDMDDDLTRIHPRNPAFGAMHPRAIGPHSWVNATEACHAASFVTVSTPALLPVYAPHGRHAVLYNMIQAANLTLPRDTSDGTFGWTGTILSHPDDPFVMGASVQRLVSEGYRFRMIGNPFGIAEALRLKDDQVICDGVVDSTAWAAAIARLHVGLAPLADTSFNAAKSWLKPLELASVGVPTVVSPRSEYRRLWRNHGIGVLAPKPKDFYREVKRLMDDATWYADAADQAREAASQLTVESNAWRWAEAWTEARKLDLQARVHAAA
jgi:glycosyltransferase involved in cell wall biosynthesis